MKFDGLGWAACCAVWAVTPLWGAESSAPTRTERPGRVITNSIGMELVRIEAGSFLMGSERGDPDERPVRRVTISRPFYVGRYEVTQEQYAKVMGENPSRFPDPSGPVENVSWEEAKAFCEKLSQLENAVYRLPSEAEWEYACRAGTQTEFYWGDAFDTSYFWCGYNSGRRPHPVGKAKPNRWGLYDMSGNVWEWCEDWYAEDAYTSSSEVDPRGPERGSWRVVRGGSWWGTPEDCRSANRLGYAPQRRLETIGFRVCRVIEEQTDRAGQ